MVFYRYSYRGIIAYPGHFLIRDHLPSGLWLCLPRVHFLAWARVIAMFVHLCMFCVFTYYAYAHIHIYLYITIQILE